MSKKGILVFARNNTQVDYIKQAYELAIRAKKFLNLPTTIVTDSYEYLKEQYQDYEIVFDNIVLLTWDKDNNEKNCFYIEKEYKNLKRYHDGSLSKKQLEFKNDLRIYSYDISPYDETLIIDSDFVIANRVLSNCFDQNNDFLIYKNAYDLSGYRNSHEFIKISDTGPDFYWATVVFFRKTQENFIFFELLKHIYENYNHYISIFQVPSNIYRNDHAFSMAIHIMNGYQTGNFAGKMPGKLYYTVDKDIMIDMDEATFEFLIEKENHIGEYTLIKTKDINVHVMNKFSLNRMIDKGCKVD